MVPVARLLVQHTQPDHLHRVQPVLQADLLAPADVRTEAVFESWRRRTWRPGVVRRRRESIPLLVVQRGTRQDRGSQVCWRNDQSRLRSQLPLATVSFLRILSSDLWNPFSQGCLVTDLWSQSLSSKSPRCHGFVTYKSSDLWSPARLTCELRVPLKYPSVTCFIVGQAQRSIQSKVCWRNDQR